MRNVSPMLLSGLLLLGAGHRAFATTPGVPLLLRHPTMNREEIVFSFAGELWSTPRAGGRAVALTHSSAQADQPAFSPDGSKIAFVANYDGQRNIYVMPAAGGEPKRLTFEPANERLPTWTPDGKRVVFSSDMRSATDYPRLFQVSIDGGLPTPLPLPSGETASFSPDGKELAYDPGTKWQLAWKRYRGGQTSKIWIARLSDSKVQAIPRKNSNDSNPMWVGDSIYFLSDRAGPVSLYRYDRASGKVDEEAPNKGFDFWSAGAGPGGIVIEQPGGLKLFEFASHTAHDVPITIDGDFPELRTHFKTLGAGNVDYESLSPSGSRAVVEARGNVFTIPAAKGDIRSITASSSSANRMPAWSPDGKSIAYLSDEGGEYRLVVAPSDGHTGQSATYDLGNSPAYYFNPRWSPDSQKVAYYDNHHVIWILDLKTKANTRVDAATYEDPRWSPSLSWSPDSKWLAYHRDLDTHISAVFVYDLDGKKVNQITDGLADAKSPAFDSGGKYLYFIASTTSGPKQAWLDLSNYGSANVVSSIYCVVLRKDLASPLAPESDEEKIADAAKPATPPAKPAPAFRIDFDGIDQRTLALPVPGGNYLDLTAATEGTFFATLAAPIGHISQPPHVSLLKFSMADKRIVPFADPISDYAVSAPGDKILLSRYGTISIVPTAAPPAPGQGMVSLARFSVKIDPAAEWRQMYHEVWRIERDYFYDPHFHGQSLTALEAKYHPFLDGLASRADLNFLFEEMLGEISVGHMFISGGDIPTTNSTPGGLLGADYSLENGRYRLARVYGTESWNPGLTAPLTQPGVGAKVGEYILALDGRDLTSAENIYERLENTAGKQVRITLGPNPDGSGAREAIVTPIPSETAIRHMAWVEDNRRTVDRLSGGKLGYVHVPDTNLGGWVFFNRYYFAQIKKSGMVIDERFNHGGEVDDYMVEQMSRPLASMWTSRYGADFSSPAMQNFGPKVLIINEMSGSGGDYFPWHFRQAKVGPLIGKRTWGGLVGILPTPQLHDGGGVTAPNIGFYNPNGTWDVENHGVDPDIDVELDPYLWRQGHDAQLEQAVVEALHLLDTKPKPSVKKPAYMDKTHLPPGG